MRTMLIQLGLCLALISSAFANDELTALSGTSILRKLDQTHYKNQNTCTPTDCNPFITEFFDDNKKGGLTGIFSTDPWNKCREKFFKNDSASPEQVLTLFNNDQRTQVSGFANTAIKTCLPALSNRGEREQKSVISNYYYALNRLQGALKDIYDEVYSIDLLTDQSTKPLQEIKCDSGLQAADARCLEHKGCASEKNHFEQYSKEKHEAYAILQMIDRQLNPTSSLAQDPFMSGEEKREANDQILALSALRNQLIAEHPILDGEEFKNTYGNTGDFNSALKTQLTANRQRLVQHQNEIKQASMCIQGGAKNCEPTDIRELLNKTPELDTSDPDISASKYLAQSMCLQTNSTKRDETNKLAAHLAVDGAIMMIPVVGVLSRAKRLKEVKDTLGSINRGVELSRLERRAEIAASGATLLVSSQKTLQSCLSGAEDIEVGYQNTKTNQPDQNIGLICPDPTQNLAVINSRNQCLGDAAFTIIDAIPAGSIALRLKNAFTKKDNLERITKAEKLLNRPLTDRQKFALIKAHNTGHVVKKEKGHVYEGEDIARKARILEPEGFTTGRDGEIRQLMDARLVGNFPSNPAGKVDPYMNDYKAMTAQLKFETAQVKAYKSNPAVKEYEKVRTRYTKDFDRLKELRGMLNTMGPLPKELQKEGLVLTTKLNLRFQSEFFKNAPDKLKTNLDELQKRIRIFREQLQRNTPESLSLF